ncbi:histidine phosphatase family protein [Nocardioides sp.]|uniref:histidine phosphatase family protein n=1 Tax=Nocardioides sp. TaxID=35761 RepID=UPI00271A3983|nr:histidine phosphatase family protein [Nocardioides sp.]MDO9457411.1 histidine phosphatase family protein [Nocardioides sp.]
MTEGRTLVLLRHGRTPWNHAGRIQGHQDVGLDDVGLAQAARTAPVLAALAPALVWSSDLERTRLTAAPLGDASGVPVTHDARLREFGFGAYEAMDHVELEARDPDSYHALRRGDYDRVTHAEPTVEVRARMVDAARDLLGHLEPGGTAVAVSHGGSIRVATAALLGWPDGQLHTLRGLDNCGWAVLHEHPSDGLLRLAAYNRTAG